MSRKMFTIAFVMHGLVQSMLATHYDSIDYNNAAEQTR